MIFGWARIQIFKEFNQFDWIQGKGGGFTLNLNYYFVFVVFNTVLDQVLITWTQVHV